MFQRLAFDYCGLKHHNTKWVKLYSRRSQFLANTLGCLLSLCLCGGLKARANVLHWEMDTLTLVITHLTKWPKKGYTDACDYTSYKVAAKNINLDKSSLKREKSFDPFYLAESAESMSFCV